GGRAEPAGRTGGLDAARTAPAGTPVRDRRAGHGHAGLPRRAPVMDAARFAPAPLGQETVRGPLSGRPASRRPPVARGGVTAAAAGAGTEAPRDQNVEAQCPPLGATPEPAAISGGS